MTERTRVKICGFTRLEDALAAARLGVDALGFNFVPASSRYVDVEKAAAMVRALPAFVIPVGLFLDAPSQVVEDALERIPGLVPQFHGVETPEECERFGRPYLKALALGTDPDSGNPKEPLSRKVQDSAARFSGASGFLLDSHAPGALGGTGVALDWDQLDDVDEALGGRPLILAGGLTAQSVARAIEIVRPWAVDLSSGVESAKGIKCADAMSAFMSAVAQADRQQVSPQQL